MLRNTVMNNKQEIIQICGDLEDDSKQQLLKVLHCRGYKIATASDGSRINLDMITKDDLDYILYFVKKLYKKELETYKFNL